MQKRSLTSSLLDRIVTIFEGGFARLLLVPALAFIGIFVVFPLVWSVILSFTDYSLIGRRAVEWGFIGFTNYIRILSDTVFRDSVINSFLFTIFSALIGQAFLGLAIALVVRMKLPEGPLGTVLKILKVIAVTLVFISWVIPEVIAGYAWAAITEKGGLLTKLLGLEERLYLTRPLETIIISNIWRGTAFSMILFMAALESIPNYIYEAAEIDGATPWQRFRHIVLPLIAHAIIVDFILITIWTFGVFTIPFIILREQPSILWTLYVYTKATSIYEPARAAAAANIMFIIVLALIIVYLKLLGRLRGWS